MFRKCLAPNQHIWAIDTLTIIKVTGGETFRRFPLVKGENGDFEMLGEVFFGGESFLTNGLIVASVSQVAFLNLALFENERVVCIQGDLRTSTAWRS